MTAENNDQIDNKNGIDRTKLRLLTQFEAREALSATKFSYDKIHSIITSTQDSPYGNVEFGQFQVLTAIAMMMYNDAIDRALENKQVKDW